MDPVRCNIIKDTWLESRLQFQGFENKESIRFHNGITALFLKLMGNIVDIKDMNGKVYHLNRNDAIEFIKGTEEGVGISDERFQVLKEKDIRQIIDEVGQHQLARNRRNTGRSF